jgi:hypothetical protein
VTATETPAEEYPIRKRVKGGRLIHACRLVFENGRGVQVGACGARANAELGEPRSAPVTCRACRAVLGEEAPAAPSDVDSRRESR